MKNYLILLFLSVLLVSCEGTDSSGKFEFEQHASKSVIPNGAKLLDLENTNGIVSITGSDTATQLYFEVLKRVKSHRSSINAEDHINDIQIFYEQTMETIQVAADHPMNNDLDYEIEFTVICPMIFDYNIIQGNGSIDIKSVSRNLNLILGNGNTNADVILLNGCAVQIETGNGGIALKIPGITNAYVAATVGNGSITMSGLPFENEISTNKTFQGTLGNGEGNIIITLGNGNLVLSGY